MNYTPEQFFRLSKEIEIQGGEHLDKMCVSRVYDMVGPNKPEKPIRIAGCGNSSIFEIPYETEKGGLQPVELCAVCDDLGALPRFHGAIG